MIAERVIEDKVNLADGYLNCNSIQIDIYRYKIDKYRCYTNNAIQ